MKISNLKSQEWYAYTNKLRPGDIGAIVESGLVARLASKLVLPATEFFHFILIGDYIPHENDFVILESIPSHGVAVGRLSWYLGKTINIYRPSREKVLLADILPNGRTGCHLTPEELGRRATWQATAHGRSGYDYVLCALIAYRVLSRCLRNWTKGRGFTVHFTEIPHTRDGRLWCTELVDEAYDGLYPVLDRDYEALPSNFVHQYLDGYLDYVCGWPGK